MATVTTTYGDVEEAELEKREGVDETNDAFVGWTEFRFPGSEEIVHRSVRVDLKSGVDLSGLASL